MTSKTEEYKRLNDILWKEKAIPRHRYWTENLDEFSIQGITKIMGYDFDELKADYNNGQVIEFLFGDKLVRQDAKLSSPRLRNLQIICDTLEAKIAAREEAIKNADKHEMNLGLPEDLDYKIILGYEGSSVVDVIVFSKEQFEKTGCEYSSEVFCVTVCNLSGSTKIITQEQDTKSVHRIERF